MAFTPSQSRKLSKKKSQDLNLVPIMNLFLVVIPMLLMMMVSVNLAMIAIDYSASSQGADSKEAGKDKKDKDLPQIITLKILMKSIELDIGAKKVKKIDIPALNEEYPAKYDFFALDQKLSELKKDEKFQDEKAIIVLAEPDVIYDALIKTIDICKQDGFTNVKFVTAKKVLLRKK